MIISFVKHFINTCCSGGIVFWADTVGPKYIYERLKRLSETYGSFFKPSRYLEERAMNGMLLVKSLNFLLYIMMWQENTVPTTFPY